MVAAMSTMRSLPSRALRPVLAAALAALAFALLTAAPAAAHSDAGEMTVLRAEQTGPSTIEVEVGIVYADEHLAEEATVSVTATSGDATAGPVTLEGGGAGSSIYRGSLEVPSPGEWSLQLVAENPTADATATVSVVEEVATTTTEAPTTTAAEEPDTSIDAEGPAASDDGEDAAANDDDDEGSSALPIVLIVVAVVLVGGGAAAVMARRRAAD